MIGEKERYHGAALARLIQDAETPVEIAFLGGSTYCVNEESYLYLKYSTKRLSPWQFTFNVDHQAELTTLSEHLPLVIAMVCGVEGVAAVGWRELQKVLPGDGAQTFQLRVTRRDGHQFRVRCSGADPLIVAESDFVALLAD